MASRNLEQLVEHGVEIIDAHARVDLPARRSGARKADPLHPVPPADGGAAASQGKSDPPAQGAEDHTGIRWQDEAWLDLERRKTIRL